MIERLEGEVEADTTEKAFCEKELSKRNVKKAGKQPRLIKCQHPALLRGKVARGSGIGQTPP